jgi:hypothetical protein
MRPRLVRLSDAERNLISGVQRLIFINFARAVQLLAGMADAFFCAINRR